jgi:alkylmercury lyase
MNTKVKVAVKRLDTILPLLSGLKSLDAGDAALYCRILNSYVERGRTLSRDEATGHVSNVDQSLSNMLDKKLIVIDDDGSLSGAYPFTSEEREHKVHINDITANCMCALDALSVSSMFNVPTIIESKCHVTGKAIYLEQNRTNFSTGTLDAWFGINWGAAASDIVCAESLCMDMIFLANDTVAHEWMSQSPGTLEIFDLKSAAEFAAEFFVPLAKTCKPTD